MFVWDVCTLEIDTVRASYIQHPSTDCPSMITSPRVLVLGACYWKEAESLM